MPGASIRRDLSQRFYAALPAGAADAVRACVTLANERRTPVYLVGGAVRDLLRGEAHLDLDFTVEGAVEPLARAFAATSGGRAVLHSRFETATVKGAAFTADFVRARREFYALPGALPDVEPASLAEDLARRDFSINAMALSLTDPAGLLIDPFAGRDDLEQGRVRVLHEASFQDDATRMIRAVRYAARLDARIEPATERWLRRDLAYCDRVTGMRLRGEMERLFEEDAAAAGASLADGLGLLAAIHPALHLAPALAAKWRDAIGAHRHAPRAELGFCLLLNPVHEATAIAVASRLHLTGARERALLDFVRLNAQSDKLASPLKPSQAVALLEGQAPAAIWALALRSGRNAAATCEAYLGSWRRMRPLLRGDDLLALGMEPGPVLGQALAQLRQARLDGEVRSREDEIAMAQRWLD
jgi:tRNA nucleotidyltransferase (CCA-adding enzyme)